MNTHKSWVLHVQEGPGSSRKEVADEPDWGVGHQHRVGFRNKTQRVPGLVHDEEYLDEIANAQKLREELNDDELAGELVNFRDLIEHQPVRLPIDQDKGTKLNETRTFIFGIPKIALLDGDM